MKKFTLQGKELWLLAEKAIWWPSEKTLLLADTHFGKVTHFRKSGIGLPDRAALSNLSNFVVLLERYQPDRVLFLGDLFHSDLNSEWLLFKDCIRKFPGVKFELVAGNHDILHDISYRNLNFEVHHKPIQLGPFTLSHEPLESPQSYNLCGHIHPGVKLVGSARQTLRLPCFHFSPHQGIMPAFGTFTGLHILPVKKSDRIFVVSQNEVLQMN